MTQAAGDIAASAEAHGGYVESMSIGQTGVVYPVDPNGVVYDSTYPNPYPSPDGAWITVRVPADELSAMVDELAGLGEVTASTVNRQDVTEQTVDLQARIDAAQASVDRLLELMTQAGSLSDLIAAEAALAERQATLESYQQQLESLESQIEMSTLSVTLVPKSEAVEADPAGFTDGLAAGWNGLVATLNGIVIALGFLIPWIARRGGHRAHRLGHRPAREASAGAAGLAASGAGGARRAGRGLHVGGVKGGQMKKAPFREPSSFLCARGDLNPHALCGH